MITTIGLETNRMLPGNAAALVGAGMRSVLLYPLIGFALRRRSERGATPPDAVVGDLQVLDDADGTDTDELGEMGEALGG